MTLQQRILAHLVKMAKMDKAYAWWSAKRYAEIHPHELAELPAMLTQAMRARNDNPTTLA